MKISANERMADGKQGCPKDTIPPGRPSIAIFTARATRRQRQNDKALEESTVNRTNPKSDLRFGQLAQEWLDAKRGSVEESTYVTYANLLDKHLLPQLGTTLLSFLNKQELDRFLLEKRFRGHLDGSGGPSDKSVSDIRAVLNMII